MASTVEMPNIMSVVVSTVNTIRVSALNHRKFEEFLTEIGSEFVTTISQQSQVAGQRKSS